MLSMNQNLSSTLATHPLTSIWVSFSNESSILNGFWLGELDLCWSWKVPVQRVSHFDIDLNSVDLRDWEAISTHDHQSCSAHGNEDALMWKVSPRLTEQRQFSHLLFLSAAFLCVSLLKAAFHAPHPTSSAESCSASALSYTIDPRLHAQEHFIQFMKSIDSLVKYLRLRLTVHNIMFVEASSELDVDQQQRPLFCVIALKGRIWTALLTFWIQAGNWIIIRKSWRWKIHTYLIPTIPGRAFYAATRWNSYFLLPLDFSIHIIHPFVPNGQTESYVKS